VAVGALAEHFETQIYFCVRWDPNFVHRLLRVLRRLPATFAPRGALPDPTSFPVPRLYRFPRRQARSDAIPPGTFPTPRPLVPFFPAWRRHHRGEPELWDRVIRARPLCAVWLRRH